MLLAELHSEITVARAYIDRCVERLVAATLSIDDAAIAKWWAGELFTRVADRCLQPQAATATWRSTRSRRAYLDAWVQTIHGGTTEIMKELIGRTLGF